VITIFGKNPFKSKKNNSTKTPPSFKIKVIILPKQGGVSMSRKKRNRRKKYSIDLGKGKVKIKFTKKEMTAYGGFSLLSVFFEKIKLREAIEKIIPITETSNNRIPIYDKVLGFALTIFAGGSRFSHMMYLGGQSILESLFSLKKLPKASTTLTRLFGKIKRRKTSDMLSEKLWEYLEKLIPWKRIKQDWLGFDSSVLVRYGKQEGAKKGYNPNKKGRPSHNPIIAFLNQSKYVVNIWNRPGNTISWNNINNFFDNVYARIKDKLKIQGVLADSGFYVLKFIKKLESENLEYIIGAVLYPNMQRKIYELSTWEEIEKGIWITEFRFKHHAWKSERRYITVKQDVTKHEKAMGKQLKLFPEETRSYRYTVYVTNSSREPVEVWKSIRKRGGDENTIKELKEDFALHGFSMHSFYATESAMLIRMLLHNLFIIFRLYTFGKAERKNRLKTLRYKYFVVPGIMGSEGNVKILRLYAPVQKIRAKFIYYFNKLFRYNPFDIPNCNAVGI